MDPINAMYVSHSLIVKPAAVFPKDTGALYVYVYVCVCVCVCLFICVWDRYEKKNKKKYNLSGDFRINSKIFQVWICVKNPDYGTVTCYLNILQPALYKDS